MQRTDISGTTLHTDNPVVYTSLPVFPLHDSSPDDYTCSTVYIPQGQTRAYSAATIPQSPPEKSAQTQISYTYNPQLHTAQA
jgi:hypothetical protein